MGSSRAQPPASLYYTRDAWFGPELKVRFPAGSPRSRSSGRCAITIRVREAGGAKVTGSSPVSSISVVGLA
jgi:hypothetical protein